MTWRPQIRWTIRRMIAGVAAVAVGLAILRPVYILVDTIFHGPVTRAFDRECSRIAREADLIGKPEAEAIRVLGEPTQVWEYDLGKGPIKTLAYSPSFSDDWATFQVHCRDGVVHSIATRGDE